MKNDTVESCNLDPKKYKTYLMSKPPITEVSAIKIVTDLAVKYKYDLRHWTHFR